MSVNKLINKMAKWISGLHIHDWEQIEDFVEVFPEYPYRGRIVKAERRRPQFRCWKCNSTKLSFYIITDVV